MDLKDKVAAFTAAKRKAKALSAQLDDAKAEALTLGEELLSDMLEAEMQNIKGADGSVVYIRRAFTAGVVEGQMPVLVKGLIEQGNDTVVSVNSMTLKGMVNEALKLASEEKGLKLDTLTSEEALAILPEPLKSTVQLSTRTTVEAKGL